MDGTSRAPSRPANALSAGAVKRSEKEGAETGALSFGNRATARVNSRPAHNLPARVVKRNEKEAHSQGAETGAFSSGVHARSPAAYNKRPCAGTPTSTYEDFVRRSARLFAWSFPTTPTRCPRITPEAWLASTRAKGKQTKITPALALAHKNVAAALAPQFGCGRSSGWQPMGGDDIGSSPKRAETKPGVNKGTF